MRHNRVYHTRGTCRIFMIVNIGFTKCTGNKTVFSIRNGLLAILVYRIAKALLFTITNFNNIFSIRKLLYYFLQVTVIFQQLDSQKTSRIFIPYVFIDADNALHLLNAPFQFRPMIDMNMAVKANRMFLLLLVSPKIMIGHIFLVPIAQVIQYFSTHFPFLIQEVSAFVNTDNNMKKLFNPLPGSANSRQHRHAEQLSELYVIQRITTRFQFIVHIERNNHTYIHVNQLGSKIQITFQIGRIHYVDYNIRRFIDNVVTNINFFRRICRKRISSRQVYNAEVIALKVEIAFFGIYGYTAIIPYMLVRTRSNIKKRRLATIGISHQSHINSTTFAQSDTFQFFFTQTHILAHPLVIIKMYRIPEHFLFANNLNHFSFLMPQ